MTISIGTNQYLLTDRNDIDGYDSKYKIGDLYLYLGEKCKYFDANNGIHVLGYAIDVNNPLRSVQDMCNELKARISNGVFGPKATRSWNGRWVVIVDFDSEHIIWNDCCGLKQIFWDTGNKCSFSSQARYIALLNNYDEDSEAIDFINKAKLLDKEFSLVLDRTLYKEIRRLLPNHYLHNGNIYRSDLCKGAGSVKLAATVLRNSIIGVCNLGEAVLTLTAGLDSRLALSGVNKSDKLTAVTLKYDDNNQDIITAIELSKKKNLTHKIIDCSNVDKNFFKKYMSHSEMAHEYWVQMCYAVLKGGFENHYWIKGSCNEIIRNSFGSLYNWQVNSKIICRLYSVPVTDFSVRAIEDWLSQCRNFCRFNNISLLDLFYWENRMGNWLAECLNEADVVCETFTPFNNRLYLENGLAVPLVYRVAPKYDFFKKIIKANGNSCLMDLPINQRHDTLSKIFFKNYIKNRIPILYGLLVKLRGYETQNSI